jgi:hypothetical protein
VGQLELVDHNQAQLAGDECTHQNHFEEILFRFLVAASEIDWHQDLLPRWIRSGCIENVWKGTSRDRQGRNALSSMERHATEAQE